MFRLMGDKRFPSTIAIGTLQNLFFLSDRDVACPSSYFKFYYFIILKYARQSLDSHTTYLEPMPNWNRVNKSFIYRFNLSRNGLNVPIFLTKDKELMLVLRNEDNSIQHSLNLIQCLSTKMHEMSHWQMNRYQFYIHLAKP